MMKTKNMMISIYRPKNKAALSLCLIKKLRPKSPQFRVAKVLSTISELDRITWKKRSHRYQA